MASGIRIEQVTHLGNQTGELNTVWQRVVRIPISHFGKPDQVTHVECGLGSSDEALSDEALARMQGVADLLSVREDPSLGKQPPRIHILFDGREIAHSFPIDGTDPSHYQRQRIEAARFVGHEILNFRHE